MNSMISTVRGLLWYLHPIASSPLSIIEAKGDDTKVLSVSWNQDWSGFIVGTNRGFKVYSCNPIRERISRDPHDSGFKVAEMLFLSNIFALVEDGDNDKKNSKKSSNNKVFIWDDHSNRCICELGFKSEVIAVRLRREHIVVVLRQKVYVYNFKNFKIYCVIETVENPRGLCCVSHNETKGVLACPGVKSGQVQIHDLRRNSVKNIKAHDSDVSCMSLTLDGMVLATASSKGTLIRIFNALDGTLLQEFRRGMERAEIYSVAISSNLKWVAVSSEKGTLHVFRLRPDILSVPTSSLSFIKGMLPKYFYDSERSVAQFSLPVSTKFIVGFGPENSVLLIGMDGRINGEGGKMVELEYRQFLSLQQTMVVI